MKAPGRRELDHYVVFRFDRASFPPRQELPGGYEYRDAVDRATAEGLLRPEFRYWSRPFDDVLPGYRDDSLVAVEKAGDVIALAFVCDDNQIGVAGHAELHYPVVRPDHRRKGIWKAMLTELFSRAKEWECEGLIVWTDRADQVDMYRRLGGEELESRPKAGASRVSRLGLQRRRRSKGMLPVLQLLRRIKHDPPGARHLLVDLIVERELRKVAARHAGGRLLDIGCGVKPYAGIMSPFVSEHVGVDHGGSQHDLSDADLIADAYDIPVDDDSFDTVLSTAVLEHLEEPEAALREAARALKPGGIAIYTAPLFWHLHEEPRDFFRYTQYGLTHLFEQAGFEMVECKPLSGYWVTTGQLFVYYLYRGNRGPLRRIPLIPVLGLIVQALSYGLESLDPSSSEWTWMYLVVARVPVRQP